jgi:hypothetical protein
MRKKEQNVALVDVLDKVLEKGAIVRGDVAIRLADVDLIYVGLFLVASSISKMEEVKRTKGKGKKVIEEKLTAKDKQYLKKLEREIKKAEAAMPRKIDGKDAQEIEQGLARLVLTLVELLRRLIEREAVRQVKMSNLSKKEIQKLGLALKALAKKMEQIRKTFGLDEKDLNLDLGPLGDLM